MPGIHLVAVSFSMLLWTEKEQIVLKQEGNRRRRFLTRLVRVIRIRNCFVELGVCPRADSHHARCGVQESRAHWIVLGGQNHRPTFFAVDGRTDTSASKESLKRWRPFSEEVSNLESCCLHQWWVKWIEHGNKDCLYNSSLKILIYDCLFWLRILTFLSGFKIAFLIYTLA